jgi:hypothetical protein
MLRRRVESVSGRLDEWKPEEKTEGLYRPIQVHVKDGVLIVPDAGGGACYLITDEEFPIVSGIRHDLGHCRARSYPSLDSRLRSDRAAQRREGEKCRAAAN